VADDVIHSSPVAGQTTPAVQTAPATARPSRSERARRTVYRGRFAALYLVLAVVAGGAVGATIVLVNRGSPAPAPAWSAWRPQGSGQREVAQIATHVGGRYHLPTGDQLATVIAGPPTLTISDGTTFQINAIAVRPDTSKGQAEASNIKGVNTAGTVMYKLCGLGNACSIGEGTPSQARLTLLRREALELALYTFKYVQGTDSVLVLLPPRPDGKAATAVFLERSDVGHELGRPLAASLPSPTVPGVGEISSDELRAIDRITRPRLYTYSYVQGQDGSPIMVLTPVLGS
jgi:hypothetical protein